MPEHGERSARGERRLHLTVAAWTMCTCSVRFFNIRKTWHKERDGQKLPLWQSNVEFVAHVVGECERHNEKRDVLDGDLREVHAYDIQSLGTPDCREKTITIRG